MEKAKILVVEDNLALLEGIRELLEYSGYEVLTAENGREALEVLQENRPDLIVSDIMMPELDGYQFHAQVRENPDLLTTPFIFLTARGEKTDIRKGKEIGVDDYITKPFEDEDLLVAVRAKLNRWERLKEHREEQIADLKHKILLTLSHEFRTPLTYIINYAEMLDSEKDNVSEEEFHDFMIGIRRGASRLNKLVEDFLILVELETGEAEQAYRFRRRLIEDFSLWLRVVVRGYEKKASEKGLTLELDIADDLPAMHVDEAYLGDAIGRLMENAIKFSKESSKAVHVRASQEGDRVEIAIQDEGIGIPPEAQAELFDLFHQIDRAKREQQGTGSGLAICSGVVRLHGGEVRVESQPDAGSTFTISLPIRPPEAEAVD